MNFKNGEWMRSLFGPECSSKGRICKDCPHLERFENRSFRGYKCLVYGESESKATDWKVSCPACGLIDRSPLPSFLFGMYKHRQRDIWKLKLEIDYLLADKNTLTYVPPDEIALF